MSRTKPIATLAIVSLTTALLVLFPRGPGQMSSSAAAEKVTPAAAHVLTRGHALVANSSHNLLTNGAYTLGVHGGWVDLWEFLSIPMPGYTDSTSSITWTLRGYRVNPKDRSRLGLRSSGNLVFTTEGGRRLWQSGTAGSGAVRLTLNRGGTLALYTASGKVVWTSRTGQRQMIGGMVLGSGRSLRSIPGGTLQGSPPLTRRTLTMQRDGNLVHRCGNRVEWQSRTHVRGSILRLYRNGALRIIAPTGRVVWSSGSGGDHDLVVFDSSTMLITSRFVHIIWQVPIDCSY